MTFCTFFFRMTTSIVSYLNLYITNFLIKFFIFFHNIQGGVKNGLKWIKQVDSTLSTLSNQNCTSEAYGPKFYKYYFVQKIFFWFHSSFLLCIYLPRHSAIWKIENNLGFIIRIMNSSSKARKKIVLWIKFNIICLIHISTV